MSEENNKTTFSPKLLVAEAAQILDTTVQNIHKKVKDLGVNAPRANNRIYLNHSMAKAILGLNLEAKIYSFQLVKGGVGKSAIAFNFAIRSALLGAKVAVIELDQQANLTRTFGIDASDKPVMIDVINQNLNLEEALVPVMDGLDLLPSRVDNALLDNTLLLGKHPLDKVFYKPLTKLKKLYDVIVIDCPPSISAAVSAAALASDVIIMPVNPTDYAMAGLELTYKELKDLFEKYDRFPELKILFNRYDGRTSLSFNMMESLIKHDVYGSLLISSYIRSTQAIENSITMGRSVFDTTKSTNEKEDFSTVTNILLGIQNG